MRYATMILALSFAGLAQNVIDRVAVVVGTQVITETEVLREVRLTQFLNGQPLDLSAEARREAAERLVDQQLIRGEMQIGGYRLPTEAETETLFRQFRQNNYPNDAAFRAVLEKYGLTEDDLKQHVAWQAAALHFAEQRFRLAGPPPPAQSADRVTDGAAPEPSKAEQEDEMDAWLKQARRGTRIQFKKGAFQ